MTLSEKTVWEEIEEREFLRSDKLSCPTCGCNSFEIYRYTEKAIKEINKKSEATFHLFCDQCSSVFVFSSNFKLREIKTTCKNLIRSVVCKVDKQYCFTDNYDKCPKIKPNKGKESE